VDIRLLQLSGRKLRPSRVVVSESPPQTLHHALRNGRFWDQTLWRRTIARQPDLWV